MATETTLPEAIFRHTELNEQPQLLAQRPSRAEVLSAYNDTFYRLMARRGPLETRLRNGEFQGLGAIAGKVQRGEDLTPEEQLLVQDYTSLVDAGIAYNGRHILNAADMIEQQNRQAAPLTAAQLAVRAAYQTGNFHMIGGTDQPIEDQISVNRFTVPIHDNAQDLTVGFIDGAPVEGLIRENDRRIDEIVERTDLSDRERGDRLARLRRDNDVLFTSSTPLFQGENNIFAARNQLEAYYNHIDKLRREWDLPDWFNGEWLLRERRILDIPEQQRGRRRLGCLAIPLLLPIPILWALTLNTSPCYGTRGQLTLDTYDPGRVRSVSFQANSEPPSIEGSMEHKLGHYLLGRDGTIYSPADDAEMRAALALRRKEDPEYVDMFIKMGVRDREAVARKLSNNQRDKALLKASDIEYPTWASLYCLSEEQIDQRVQEALDQQRNPQWHQPLTNAWNWLQRHIPNVTISVR